MSEVIHLCPKPEDYGIMQCCGKTPFEVSRWDRLAIDPVYVTCGVEYCPCACCDEARRKAKLEVDGDFASYISRFMILCPDCGNKRCPKATDHTYACSGSNEPNQEGSIYHYGFDSIDKE